MSIKPKLTDEQRKVLDALWKCGYKWVAKDENEDEYLFAYADEPKRSAWSWYGVDYVSVPHIACLNPLLPNWRIPIDIEKTLKEENQ